MLLNAVETIFRCCCPLIIIDELRNRELVGGIRNSRSQRGFFFPVRGGYHQFPVGGSS